jgi:hypothetical protein
VLFFLEETWRLALRAERSTNSHKTIHSAYNKTCTFYSPAYFGSVTNNHQFDTFYSTEILSSCGLYVVYSLHVYVDVKLVYVYVGLCWKLIRTYWGCWRAECWGKYFNVRGGNKKWQEKTEYWAFYSSQIINSVLSWIRVRRTKLVESIQEMRKVYKIPYAEPEGRRWRWN